jgi:hypothetical protein
MNANRVRVLDFEKETEDRLATLSEVEKEILSVGQLRNRWLLSVSNIDEVETETFSLRLKNYKAQIDLANLKLDQDRCDLESQYEFQTLNYLILATKPLENDETQEARAKKLYALARTNLEELSNSLRASVELRARISLEIRDYILALAKLRISHDNRHHSIISELQERIGQYADRMKETVIQSHAKHRKITGEYLILRHNARVAKEILSRSQNEAGIARKQLQEKLEKLTDEANKQREKMEVAAVQELKVMTDDIRNAVIRKEHEVNGMRRSIENLVGSKKNNSIALRRSLRAYKKNKKTLNKARKRELESVTQELNELRAMCKEIENEISRGPVSEFREYSDVINDAHVFSTLNALAKLSPYAAK